MRKAFFLPPDRDSPRLPGCSPGGAVAHRRRGEGVRRGHGSARDRRVRLHRGFPVGGRRHRPPRQKDRRPGRRSREKPPRGPPGRRLRRRRLPQPPHRTRRLVPPHPKAPPPPRLRSPRPSSWATSSASPSTTDSTPSSARISSIPPRADPSSASPTPSLTSVPEPSSACPTPTLPPEVAWSSPPKGAVVLLQNLQGGRQSVAPVLPNGTLGRSVVLSAGVYFEFDASGATPRGRLTPGRQRTPKRQVPPSRPVLGHRRCRRRPQRASRRS